MCVWSLDHAAVSLCMSLAAFLRAYLATYLPTYLATYLPTYLPGYLQYVHTDILHLSMLVLPRSVGIHADGNLHLQHAAGRHKLTSKLDSTGVLVKRDVQEPLTSSCEVCSAYIKCSPF